MLDNVWKFRLIWLIINIFTFRATPSLKFSDDLVNFLSFFSTYRLFLLFLPTYDLLKTSTSVFVNKCHKNIYRSIQYIRLFPKNVNFLGNMVDFLTFQIDFYTHKRLFFDFFRLTNIFNFYAQKSQKFSHINIYIQNFSVKCLIFQKFAWFFEFPNEFSCP